MMQSLTLLCVTLGEITQQPLWKLVTTVLEIYGCLKVHVYLRIPFIFDFQEDLDLKLPWRKRDSPFSPRLSPSSVNRPTSFIGILCFRLVCHGSCTVCVYYVV